MSLLFMVIFFALAVLIFRLSFLQLSEGEELLKRAENNRYVTQSIPAPRGNILDRDGNELVRNKPAFTITFQPLNTEVQDSTMLISELAPVFNLSIEDLYKAMDPHAIKYSPSMARKVITNAPDQIVAYVREHADELPGFNVIVEPIREYVRKDFASHVVGYLNDIPADYYEEHKEEYQQTDLVGTAGVESQYEKFLHGKNGTYKVEVNINYQPVNKDKAITVEPVKGHDLKLTIHSKLQEATENALKARVEEMGKTIPTVKHGAAVAMNPKTGEVLAMASYPDYDPTMWVEGISAKDYATKFAPAEMNRTMQQVYEPGSTIKMSTVLIGLHEGKIKPSAVIYDPGYTKFLDTTIRSWKSIGDVDARRALAESSNVYMIETFKGVFDFNSLSRDVNHYLNVTLKEKMNLVLDYHKEMGLGLQTTGVDLPYEAKGQITQEGYVSDLAFASFGQNEKYTLLQLAQYTSTIANEGKRMQPYVVSEIIKPDGTTLQKTEPKLLGETSFTKDEYRVVREGMLDVSRKPYGTFYGVFGNYPIQVASKTGTAETGRGGTENSVYVGYAPYDDPQIAIAIIIPDNKHMSQSGATLGPIAKAMMDAYFNLGEQSAEKKEEKKAE